MHPYYSLHDQLHGNEAQGLPIELFLLAQGWESRPVEQWLADARSVYSHHEAQIRAFADESHLALRRMAKDPLDKLQSTRACT